MGGFETTAITVPYRRHCEDEVKVLDFDTGVVIAVADGAGGTGAGSQAARTVIREVAAAASLAHDQAAWSRILREADLRVGEGESTGVVVAWSPGGIVGASVGDSQAWLIVDGEIKDLTKSQARKPLLGSGEAEPTGFFHPPAAGFIARRDRRLLQLRAPGWASQGHPLDRLRRPGDAAGRNGSAALWRAVG